MTGRNVAPPGRGDADEAVPEDLASPAERYGAQMSARPSATLLQSRVIEQERRTLEEVFATVEEDQSVARAAALVVGARRRLITGAGRSAAFARLLDVDLSLGLSQVLLVGSEGARPLDVLADVRATDVLVAFSMWRYRRETVAFAERFARRGGTLVAITDAPDAPLVPLAAEAVVIPTTSASVTHSATAVAAVCHLLAALTTASAKGARRRLAEREVLAREMGCYL